MKDKRLVHLWETSGLIACRGLTIADVARPWPESPLITPHEAEVTCPTCLATIKPAAKGAA